MQGSWTRSKYRLVVLPLAFVLLGVSAVHADIEITLKNDFIQKFKNRATIDANFTVVKTHHNAKPAKEDGDIHSAGTAPEVGLNFVAEMMNAKSEKDVIQSIVGAEGTGNPLAVTGAWRLWCEHGGDSKQKQGDPLEPIVSTNPDHVFEIHPVTEVAGDDVTQTFRKISGYKYKDAEQAFHRYETLDSELTCDSATTTIRTGMAGYNYVDFVIELNESPTHDMGDGLTVMVAVKDKQNELLVRNRRMVFVKGTTPYETVKQMKQGDTLRVLGIPRFNLALVSWRCENAATRPEVLTWSLPYEMIIVAVL